MDRCVELGIVSGLDLVGLFGLKGHSIWLLRVSPPSIHRELGTYATLPYKLL